jgi:predicted ATPase
MAKYVITGGPGAGKTSLLLALQEMQYHCFGEASRQLIMEEMGEKSNCLPWIDLPCFAERALERMVAAYEEASDIDPVFFDRGIPDIIAYLTIAGLSVPEKYHAIADHCIYDSTVFLLPPWPEIYIRDDARWQTFEEAEAIYHQIKVTYQAAGYQLMELPKATTGQRAMLIRHHLEKANNQHSKKVLNL